MSNLLKQIQETIEKSGATYGETINALKRLLVIYQDKGNNLLDSASIKEVATCERFKKFNRTVDIPHAKNQ